MVKTTYGIVGKDVGVSNTKCGIKILTFQQIIETNNIVIPNFQRDIQESKVDEIVNQFKEEHKTHQNYFIKHGYVMCLCKIGKKLYLIDGQHRYKALKRVYNEGFVGSVLVRIQLCESIDEMKKDFALLNINSNIPIVYTYFEDEFVQELLLNLKSQLKTHYGSCFSRSSSKTCHRMHIDDFMGLLDVEYVKSLYLQNNKVQLFEKLEVMNEVVKLILSEHDENEIHSYISKNDYPIVKEHGFYLSLKNVNWTQHFVDPKNMIEINLLPTKNTKTQKSVYKKKQIPKALREVVIHNHFGDRFISHCFVCYKSLNRNDVQIGHIEPEVKGGETIESNLRCICKCCNSSMGMENMLEFKATYFPFNMS